MKLSILSLLILCISCGKQVDPEFVDVTLSIANHHSYARVIPFSSEDPTSKSDVNCFGVMVRYSEDSAAETCNTSSGSFNVDEVAGFVALSGSISMSVKIGIAREFKIVGIKSETGTCLPFLDNLPGTQDRSSGFVIGEATQSITSSTEEILITGDFNAAKKMTTCSGSLFSYTAAEGAVTVSGVFQMGSVTQGSSAHVDDTSGNEFMRGLAVDSNDNTYHCGSTTAGLGETNGGSSDLFVVKRNSSGIIQWLSQIGSVTAAAHGDVGSTVGNDRCFAVTTDSSGNVYFTGSTSGDLATGETVGGAEDIFVAKLNSSGALQWLKQVGTAFATADSIVADASGVERGNGIVTDSSGNTYIVAQTDGNFAETNAGSEDLIIMKFDSSGNHVTSKHFGATTSVSESSIISTTGADFSLGIEIDDSNNIFSYGTTTSNFSETNGGATDTFFMKLDTSLNVQMIKQIGSVTQSSHSDVSDASGNEKVRGVDFDSKGNIYIGFETDGSLVETVGGSLDVALAKYNSSGVLQWVRQLGATTTSSSSDLGDATGSESLQDTKVSSSDNIYLGMDTTSNFGETSGGSSDVAVARISPEGNLHYISHVGSATESANTSVNSTSGAEDFSAMEFDSSGNLWVAGRTGGALGETNGGSNDEFVMKLTFQ